MISAMRWMALLLLTFLPVVLTGAEKKDPFTIRFEIDGTATKITLEFAEDNIKVVKDTDTKWQKRLGELYLMHWPRKRVKEPARVYIGKKVSRWTVEKAVKALRERGLKLVRVESTLEE